MEHLCPWLETWESPRKHTPWFLGTKCTIFITALNYAFTLHFMCVRVMIENRRWVLLNRFDYAILFVVYCYRCLRNSQVMSNTVFRKVEFYLSAVGPKV